MLVVVATPPIRSLIIHAVAPYNKRPNSCSFNSAKRSLPLRLWWYVSLAALHKSYTIGLNLPEAIA
ncbi:hypothetical protein [Trichocoleus sp. FACHB-40]|uniref:hypothetical protein n=1 Tax=Trichocoleus sp. FACHB-40 TaxID=2692870 RepID=UPI0016848F5A|nr:hypothetical protein [Trichocoleus sp. FACHB-40]